MEVTRDNLNLVLEFLPISINRKLCNDYDIEVSSRSKAPYRNKLLEKTWTENEISTVQEHLDNYIASRNPMSHYVFPFKNLNYDGIKENIEDFENTDKESIKILEENTSSIEFQRTLKDEGLEQTNNGLEREMTWTNQRGHIIQNNSLMKIDARNPQTAKNISEKILDEDSKTKNVGHNNLRPRQSKTLVSGFIEDLKGQVRDNENSEELNDQSLVIIDDVEIRLETGQINSIEFQSDANDISEHEDVQEYTSEGGKIRKVRGDFMFNMTFYSFEISYNAEGVGRVKISKAQRGIVPKEQIEDAWNFLFEIYEDYFVEFEDELQ